MNRIRIDKLCLILFGEHIFVVPSPSAIVTSSSSETIIFTPVHFTAPKTFLKRKAPFVCPGILDSQLPRRLHNKLPNKEISIDPVFFRVRQLSFQMVVGGLFKDFSGWTSSHGIPQIGAATNICVRIVWIGIFVGSLGLFAYQLYIIIDKYLQFGVTVSTELKFEERNFPAVTICNLNPYKYKKDPEIQSEPDLESRLKDPSEDLKDMVRLVDEFNAAVANPTNSADEGTFKFNEVNTSIRVQAKAKESLVYVAGKEVRLRDFTYTRDQFILECHYEQKRCDFDKDFIKIMDPIYGACYQFNHQAKPVTYTNTRSGPQYGLRLLLQNKQELFLPMTEVAGARIAVHTQNQEPFPDAFGYNAAIGFSTSFAIKYTRTVRLSEPYGDCTDEVGDRPHLYNTSYTMEGCFRSCFQNKLVSDCGCADPRFAIPEGKLVCDITQKFGCTDKYSVSQKEKEKSTTDFSLLKNCKCPQRCNENIFGVTMSSARWPAEDHNIQACVTKTKQIPAQIPVGISCNDWYHDNTMVVEIYFDRMNYKLLEESPAYGLYSVVLNFGGQLGLWQGASVITLIEFFALGILICLFCTAKKKGADHISDEDKHEKDLDDIDNIVDKKRPSLDPYSLPDDGTMPPPKPH